MMDWKAEIGRIKGEPLYEDQAAVDQAYVDKVEDAIKVRLPADYRDYLLAAGGIVDASPRFEAEDGSASLISVFLGADPEGQIYDLLDNIGNYRGRVPQSLIPIALDPGGNLVCLGITAPDTGKVYFWDHENESMTDFPWRKNVHKIADSFTKFIENLRPEEDEEN